MYLFLGDVIDNTCLIVNSFKIEVIQNILKG